MTTKCFAPIRGSVIRVTGLTDRGGFPDVIPYATSKSVAKVTISEVSVSGNNDVLKTPENERRIKITKPAQTIRNLVDVEFLRVDPALFTLVAGIEPVYLGEAGFGQIEFGVDPFGLIPPDASVRGFDATPRKTAPAFALEVWSKLAGGSCEGGQQWGYTVFPFLKGGRLSGFSFSNGRVSFTMRGAQTRRRGEWGVGPYDLTGPFQRLESPVSGNSGYRMITTSAAPPVEGCGITAYHDVLDNGNAANPMPDPDAVTVVVGGGAFPDDEWIIEGGGA